MKKTLFLLCLFVFFVSFSLSSEQEGYYSSSFARLSYVKGDVFVQRGGDMGYEEGAINLAIVEGDKLGTRQGRAEIHFGRENYLRIDSFTQIDFVVLPQRGDDTIKLHLLSGNIYLRVNFLSEARNFEIHTPDGSFYILENGLYRFAVSEDKETELFVFEGEAEAAGEERSLLVRAEEKVAVSDGRFLSEPARFGSAIDDDLAEWNISRDRLRHRSPSRRYLPQELHEYEDELADNGRWAYEPPYGYVWVPQVHHVVWRPYFYGRWVWYPLVGWTWVSSDPWGWCVHHYGRWQWRFGLGWYWIPTVHWGPAWVHWHWGYDYIGWCPLSFYGYPVVIINNHFYGRYYDRYYPLNSRALVVIRKEQLQSPQVSRAALSQDRVVHLGKISLSSKQLSIQPVINRQSLQSQVAAKVLSRSNMRSVTKNYDSQNRVMSSRPGSSRSGVLSRRLTSSVPHSGIGTFSSRLARDSGSAVSSKTLTKTRPESSLGSSRFSGGRVSSSSRNESDSSKMEIFPSRQTPSFSRRIPSYSSREAKSFSSRELASSHRTFSSPSLSPRSSSSSSFAERRTPSTSSRWSTSRSISPSFRPHSSSSRSAPSSSSGISRSTVKDSGSSASSSGASRSSPRVSSSSSSGRAVRKK